MTNHFSKQNLIIEKQNFKSEQRAFNFIIFDSIYLGQGRSHQSVVNLGYFAKIINLSNKMKLNKINSNFTKEVLIETILKLAISFSKCDVTCF